MPDQENKEKNKKEKIPRTAYELPLLRSLVELGGALKPDIALYQQVAEKMGFVNQAMDYDVVHARERWTYELQWVRHNLVQKGDMDGSKRVRKS